METNDLPDSWGWELPRARSGPGSEHESAAGKFRQRAPERFDDREHAGRELALALAEFRGQDVLVLGIPRGGVPVAAEVARALDAELDVIVAKKIGAPLQPEFALGAVTADGHAVVDRESVELVGIDDAWLGRETARMTALARERETKLRAGRPAARVRDRVVLLVDDGLATGATMHACASAVRRGAPRRLIVAVPVGSAEACSRLRAEADEVVCLSQPRPFHAVGLHYDSFDQTSDAEVAALLADADRRRRAH